MKFTKSLLILGAFIIISGLVIAIDLRTTYNPFSGKLDYFRSSNFSGENITADFYFGNGSQLDISTGDLTDDNTYVQIIGDTMTGNLTVPNITIDNSIKDANSNARIFFENGVFIVEG